MRRETDKQTSRQADKQTNRQKAGFDLGLVIKKV